LDFLNGGVSKRGRFVHGLTSSRDDDKFIDYGEEVRPESRIAFSRGHENAGPIEPGIRWIPESEQAGFFSFRKPPAVSVRRVRVAREPGGRDMPDVVLGLRMVRRRFKASP